MGIAPENPSAFPAFENVAEFDEDQGKYVGHMLPVDGMKLRDYFAAKALNTIGITMRIQKTEASIQAIALLAYQMADAMLAERSK